MYNMENREILKEKDFVAIPGVNGTLYHIMCEDTKVDDVFLSDDHSVVVFTLYEKPGIRQPFSGGKLDLSRFYSFIKSRCYEDGRADLGEILDILGLEENNPWLFVKKTHGVKCDDYFWIKFNDEDISWKDVNPYEKL